MNADDKRYLDRLYILAAQCKTRRHESDDINVLYHKVLDRIEETVEYLVHTEEARLALECEPIPYEEYEDEFAPIYSRGKSLVAEGLRSSVKPRHWRLFQYTQCNLRCRG